jgi:hypothetical protein
VDTTVSCDLDENSIFFILKIDVRRQREEKPFSKSAIEKGTTTITEEIGVAHAGPV